MCLCVVEIVPSKGIIWSLLSFQFSCLLPVECYFPSNGYYLGAWNMYNLLCLAIVTFMTS
jgi:hypothetical protein